MRLFNISILGVAAISMASAGSIEIGAGTVNGVTTQGLTVTYIATATQTGNAWAGERAYVGTLFAGAVISNGSLNGVLETSGAGAGTVAGSGSTTPTYQNGFQQLTDPNNSVTFGMLDDAANGNNFWVSGSGSTTGATSITVPVNVSGASNAYILLNDYFGVNGSITQNDTVEFFFSGGFTDTFTLINGNQIDAALRCTTALGGGSLTPCSTFAQSTSSSSTDSAWTGQYNDSPNLSTAIYNNTSGNVALGDLSFNISQFSGQVLQSIEITDNNNLTNSSRLALSAITVSGENAQLVTPEPSTVLLLLGGLAVMGFARQRRKARQ